MKQSDQSKQLIRDALFALMEKKAFQEITIKDIAEKAGIARLTFYRNFDSKEDIIRYHIQCGFMDFLHELRDTSNADLREMISLCYRYWHLKRDELILLSNQKMEWLVREPFETYLHIILEQMGLKEKYTYFQIQFLIGGMLADMLAWIKNPRGNTPEDMAEEIIQLLKI